MGGRAVKFGMALGITVTVPGHFVWLDSTALKEGTTYGLMGISRHGDR